MQDTILSTVSDFVEVYTPLMEGSNANDIQEFFDVCGKQHYRLLAYLSTLYNDSTIIDIGTHRGNSALALSYNKTNTIYSFDIVDNVANPNIRSRENIQFQMDNLFEPEGRAKWTETIMKCPFIFLDVDPHNGTMEIDFYEFLESIQYPGFVVCDDIWHFKEMRNEFWYKIPYQNRVDITEVGHWSGTGIFSFTPLNIYNGTLKGVPQDIQRQPLPINELKCNPQDEDCPISNLHRFTTLNIPPLFVKRDNTNWTLVTASNVRMQVNPF